jgi:hypothetical protein
MATNALQVVRVPITELYEDQENARKHTKENIIAVKASLARFGQQKPLVVNAERRIVCGNATWIAARQLGWTEIDVVYTTLHGSEMRAFAISDNRTAELAEWNLDLLASQVGENIDEFDWQNLGWSAGALDALLGTGSEFDVDGEEGAISDTEEKDKAQIRERVKTISLTKDQRDEFEHACTLLREEYLDPDLSEGACVENLATRYRTARENHTENVADTQE